MITFKQFITEGYSEVSTFMVQCWGKLLYLDYFNLPTGEVMSGHPEFLKLMRDYKAADEDEIEELDEWINEGAPLKNGKKLFTRETVDFGLSLAQHKAGKLITLYRFDHTPNKIRPGAWISLTRKETGYGGDRRSFEIAADDLIIDAHGLADDHEVIVRSDLLVDK